MVRVLIKHKDADLREIKRYGNIVYESRLMKVIGVETDARKIEKLRKIPGVIRVREAEKGYLMPIN